MNENRSQELNELFSALGKAQDDIRVAVKDAANPFFKSKYANLQMVMEASRPALCKNNLCVVQQLITDHDHSYLVTTLGHSSGQWISSRMVLNPLKTDIQSLGSYITYMRRYCYSALVGVYDGEEDDDGNNAMPEEKKVEQKKMITTEQYRVLYSVDYEISKAIKANYKIKSLDELTEEQAAIIIKRIPLTGFVDTTKL